MILNIQKNIDFYKKRVSDDLKFISEKIVSGEKSSQGIDYSPMMWTLARQTSATSQHLKETVPGIVFEGTKNMNEVVYSTEGFDSGRHLIRFVIE